MDYKRIYERLIDRARSRVIDGYVERHHIVPKCMGGGDQISNLVALTPEEHFLAHVLLVKIHPEERNLILAVQKMTLGRKGRPARKMYGWLKRKHAARMRELQSGDGNSQFGTKWYSDLTGERNLKLREGDSIPEGVVPGKNKWLAPKKRIRNRKLKGKVTIASQICDPSLILQRYESGETTDSIGVSLGVSGKAVIMYLNRNFPDRKRFAPRQNRKTLD
jgi:hypothetical protein